jgi:phosphoglycerol transferase MdoB-like AlkP superfamily enzyme
MTNIVLIYIGAAVITIWGIAHIIPTKSVVSGFGSISADNKRIITMEWIAEGLTLCFIGLLVLFITIFGGSQNPVSLNVYRASALMLVVMAGLTAFTGARTSIVPIKICPIVKALVATLFFLGTYL